jgi:hypothetical protein
MNRELYFYLSPIVSFLKLKNQREEQNRVGGGGEKPRQNHGGGGS